MYFRNRAKSKYFKVKMRPTTNMEMNVFAYRIYELILLALQWTSNKTLSSELIGFLLTFQGGLISAQTMGCYPESHRVGDTHTSLVCTGTHGTVR